MARVVTVTQTYIVDGEVMKEDTFPIIGVDRIDGVGCPPVTIDGFGRSKFEIRFTFDPPLLVPDDAPEEGGP